MGPSPPRTKKEASADAEPSKALAAAEAENAKAERAAAKQAAREERRVAKEAAREERRRAAVERQALRQAEQAERETVRAEADAEVAAADAKQEAALAATAIAQVDSAPDVAAQRERARDERRQAKAGKREQRAEAKAAKIAAATPATPAPDPMVDPPPAIADGSEPAGTSVRRRLTLVVLILGALGLLFSVILAIGALLAAVDATPDGGLNGAVSRFCDVLVGPLGGLFEFSGENAETKTDLVTRGVASMVYLAIGLSLPALVRRKDA